MCLLIAKKSGEIIPAEHLRNGYRANPDGAGLAYIRKGRVTVEKGFFTVASFMRAWEAVPASSPALVHFRWATHGGLTAGNCHPFRLPGGVAVAHNGVIPGMGSPEKSDTLAFCESVLAPALSEDRDAVHRPDWLASLAPAIGSSKLAFLSPDGTLALVNEQLGRWIGGVWYSNDSYRDPLPARWWEAPAGDCGVPDWPGSEETEWIREDLTCATCGDVVSGYGWRSLTTGDLCCAECRHWMG